MTRSRLGLADADSDAQLLYRVIEILSAGLDLDGIAQGVADLITETTSTDVCFVHLLDPAGDRLRLRGATPPFNQFARRIELPVGEGVSGWVAAHCAPAVITDNKRADRRYRYIPELRGEEFTSMASVPMMTRPGDLVGVLNVHTRDRREFTKADVELLGTVAGLMAGAIENASLHSRLAEREEALERFAERIVLLQETERRRLAGEIHDGISQRIVSLSFHLSAAADAVGTDPAGAAEQIARAQELAAGALDETRNAIAGLRPPVLDDLGLAASLESLARSTPLLNVQVDTVSTDLPEHVETAVYRIAQEALQNVMKHANAAHVHLRLSVAASAVLLEISDDGTGFDPATTAERAGPVGYGLPGMQQRAELLGGQLTADSSPGRGTVVRLRVPISSER
ncbi:MAG TPA: GAF domain-containing sensor histidine kinase [Pseudonocardiaceae bacterium]|nr:GAF domain-containing sensor histidine kinase [Pseudonocardiaceae bacterium]